MSLRELWSKIIDTPIDFGALDADIGSAANVLAIVVLVAFALTLLWKLWEWKIRL